MVCAAQVSECRAGGGYLCLLGVFEDEKGKEEPLNQIEIYIPRGSATAWVGTLGGRNKLVFQPLIVKANLVKQEVVVVVE